MSMSPEKYQMMEN